MKVEWRFSNGTSTLILIPDTERDKTSIRMFSEGSNIKLGASPSPETLVVVTEIVKQGKADAEASER